MAGFDDSNDIKINVTLDTAAAVKAAQDLKTAIESSLKSTETQFQKIETAVKDVSSKIVKEAKGAGQAQVAVLDKTVAATSAAADKIAKITADAAAKKVREEQKAQALILDAQKVAARQAEIIARDAASKDRTRRTELLKEVAQLNKERAMIMKTPRAKAPPGLGDIGGSGKALQALEGVAVSLGNRFGFLTLNASQAFKVLSAFGPIGVGLAALAGGVAVLDKVNQKLLEIGQQAGRLEGLKTGFETLQKSVGSDAVKSLEALRKSTQGLISDTEIYQKANQAVLLNVPTEVFTEAAGAAVKLGRAMGIDAGFALESLSLGLGRQSRLYLDNLGIVVSAEEAYQKFAIANNIVGRSLTDSEKRAAFYAEALGKIKERAQELPDIVDSVGVASQKVAVAQENVNTAFLTGFNSSTDLAKAFKEQAEITQSTAGNTELFGKQLAKLGSGLVDVYNDIIRVVNGLAQMGVAFLDVFVRASPEKLVEDLNKQIERSQEIIRKQVEEIRLFGPALGDTYTSIRANIIQAATEDMKEAQAEIKGLGFAIQEVRDGAGVPIKIKVDLTEVLQAQAAFKGLMAGLRASILEQGGTFEVAGISPEALSVAGDRVEALTLKVLKSKGSFAGFDAEFKKIQDSLAFDIQKEKATQLTTKLVQLKSEQALLGDTSSAAYKKINQAIGEATAELVQYNGNAGLSVRAEEATKKVLEARVQSTKKGYGELVAEQKRQTKETVAGIKKQEKEYESLSKALRRALGNAIPNNFQKELVNLFNGGGLSAEQFEKALIDIGKRAKAAGVDMAAFVKEVVELKKLADKGVTIRVDAQTSEADAATKTSLKNAQAGMLNLRSLFYGKDSSGEQGGAFFGFSLKEFFSEATSSEEIADAEAALAGALSGGLELAIQLALTEGITTEDAAELGAQIGASIGAGVGAAIGGTGGAIAGAAIGSTFGQIVGEGIKRNFGDSPGAKQKKQIDKYFSALFHKDRLVVIIDDNFRAAFSEAALLARDAMGLITPADGIARVSNPNQRSPTRPKSELDDMFNLLPAQSQAALEGVALAFGQIVGVGVEASRNIAYAFANNIGGSLQNLQVLIQGTGESFDDLSNGIVEAFLDAQLTIGEAYNALVQLQNLYQTGLPDAVGDFAQASQNLLEILREDRPGRYATDSLRDIAAEGREAGASFDTVISQLGQTFAFTAQQQAALFENLRLNGATSLAELEALSEKQLLTILLNIQRIREDATAPLATAPQEQFESAPAPSSGGSRGKSPAQEALEKLREETKKLVRESLEYESILKKITSGELTRAAAGAAIIKLQIEIENALKRRTRLEAALEAELDKGRKANKKRLADLAAQLDAVNKKIDGFTDKTEKTTRVFKELDLKGVIPFIKDANNLGVVMKQVGVTFETASDILVKGFLQGRMTLGELRAEMDKTEQTLGAGIPNSIGAVTDAFQNLIDAGTQGGQFSTDAFTDIFAEFREKFTKEGSALREAERVQLNANLALARDALANAVGPDATAVARKTLEQAKKTLEDFNASVAAPDLADLRSQLTATFGAGEVDKFFRALDESGLKTFEDFEKAGADSIVGILAKLDSLGFNFGQTSQDIVDAQKALRDAEKEANAGFDPLQQAIDLVKGLNEGAGQLPPVFNATTEAIQGLNGPLAALADGFDDIIEKVAKLSGQKFENDVVFNIRTTGDAGGQALVELLFGDGEGATVGIPSPVSGGTENSANKIARFRKEIADLKQKGLNERRRRRISQLQGRIAQLGG